MICSECNNTYLSEPGDRADMASLYGLCARCGTEPRFRQFVLAFGRTSVAALLSLELILLLSFLANWKWILAIGVLIALIYVSMNALVSKGEQVTYKSLVLRRKATWVQWLMGGIFGFGLAWFLAIKVLCLYV